jgi:uncharacterized protein YhdP
MNSNQLAINDFMTTSGKTATDPSDSKQAKQTKKAEAMKIPAFLNCTLTAKAKTVFYDNLTMKDVSGKLIIKDEKVSLENVKTSIFGGTIAVNGAVSTKGKTPTFNMNLGLNEVNISQSFTQLEMLKKIAPIAGIINGKLNSTIKLNGNLDAIALTPDLKSLSGDLLGQLLSTTVNAKNSTLLTSLGSNVKFLDLSKLNLNDVKAALSFKDGKVNVKPFDIKYNGINATIGGSHGFDQNMNYNVKFDVPAKYLGAEANAFLSKLSPADVAKLDNIPINALLTGNFSSPKISTDMKTAVSNLTNQLVKQQKEKLVKQGTSALTDLITKNMKKSSDTTKTGTQKEDIKAKASDLINSLFKKK